MNLHFTTPGRAAKVGNEVYIKGTVSVTESGDEPGQFVIVMEDGTEVVLPRGVKVGVYKKPSGKPTRRVKRAKKTRRVRGNGMLTQSHPDIKWFNLRQRAMYDRLVNEGASHDDAFAQAVWADLNGNEVRGVQRLDTAVRDHYWVLREAGADHKTARDLALKCDRITSSDWFYSPQYEGVREEWYVDNQHSGPIEAAANLLSKVGNKRGGRL